MPMTIQRRISVQLSVSAVLLAASPLNPEPPPSPITPPQGCYPGHMSAAPAFASLSLLNPKPIAIPHQRQPALPNQHRGSLRLSVSTNPSTSPPLLYTSASLLCHIMSVMTRLCLTVY